MSRPLSEYRNLYERSKPMPRPARGRRCPRCQQIPDPFSTQSRPCYHENVSIAELHDALGELIEQIEQARRAERLEGLLEKTFRMACPRPETCESPLCVEVRAILAQEQAS